MKIKQFKQFLIEHEKALFLILVFLTALITILQVLKIRASYITEYGADICGPILIYYWTRKNKGIIAFLTNKFNTPISTFLLVLAGCVLWEIRQKLYQGYGIFDPVDIFVYAISLTLCFAIDITNCNKLKS
jgi:hypothetical protein